MGAWLYRELEGEIPVVGVAKTIFQGECGAKEVFRGESRNPLYVTAAGVEAGVAAEHVRTMHGEHRVPTMLKRVDRLARTAALPAI